MTRRYAFLVFTAVLLRAVPVFSSEGALASGEKAAIVCPTNASVLETLAAREIRRYVYLRTGRLLPVVPVGEPLPERDQTIVVAKKGCPILASWAGDAGLRSSLAELDTQSYLLRTLRQNGRRIVLVVGGDEVGTLYGAYRFAEHLGVRFYLHGDVIPDERVAFQLPDLDEQAKPLFELRGIQPFHDFPEGPDWWNLDDYGAVISQLPKLRMNFIALHTYPEGAPNAEPTAWIGMQRDVENDGRVTFSYPASYQNTLRGNWGYAAKKTGEFIFGSALLFEHDAYGADVMAGMCPQPESPEDCNELFHKAGEMLSEAFHFAHILGVQTCVGTEAPLAVPKRVQERLKAAGKDPADPTVIGELYEGIFLRAARAYPLDYYWFWTPEGWTWQGASDAQVGSTIGDLRMAYEAAKRVKAPFRLATCGWVLGPQGDRAMFDRVLPKDVAVSCINRQVGKEPVDPAFAEVKGRAKWAIPWLEDDPALTSPQLWVGRMRRDAADALRYGCTGLLGIHWRTRILGPNVSALAWAAWDQTEWARAEQEFSGPVGGQVAAFPNNPIADTDDDPLYQTVRYDVSAYRFVVPNGKYTVTLKFCEPHYSEKGKRVFDVKLEGKKVIEELDIFARVGQNRALDYTFEGVEVADGGLDIDFVHRVEFPSIAAISIEGPGFTRKVNCGGPAYRDYAADPLPPPRDLPTTDFYRDWALHQFGPEIAADAAALFEKLDGALPRPSDWVNGPGGLTPDPRKWEQVSGEYTFVDQLAALRPTVRGPGNLERFDYWLNNLRYMGAIAHARCVWAQFNEAIKAVKSEKDVKAASELARQTALPLRKELVQLVGEVYAHLLQTVSNTGEMGTVANWDQHILPTLLVEPGRELAQILGEDLPSNAVPSSHYIGPARVIVPTVRTSLMDGELLKLKVIFLADKPARGGAAYWRPLGSGEFAREPLVHVARGVYLVHFPPSGAKGTDLEYYVEVTAGDGQVIRFPATAPEMNQTLVVVPRGT